ncbi:MULTISPECIES: hypothetical protein [unclassified Microcoleus]|uniref:hypothetical protein n=1 Tax=unclassified Microcoleus TaxID=2642155 RepID=UPI002FD4079B
MRSGFNCGIKRARNRISPSDGCVGGIARGIYCSLVARKRSLERLHTEQERQRAEAERDRADRASGLQADRAHQQKERWAAYLRSLRDRSRSHTMSGRLTAIG